MTQAPKARRVFGVKRGRKVTRGRGVPQARETPPLTRGRPRRMSSEDLSVRNTPAYAGKTRADSRACRPNGKHPRLRGEDLPKSRMRMGRQETPPLTRGRRRVSISSCEKPGNTPAYAGKTKVSNPLTRIRLETPPLTRGRQSRRPCRRHILGNTPAYAGKTPFRRNPCSSVRKHPRLRGEDPDNAEEAVKLGETPPLTRGRPTYAEPGAAFYRNTPAYAGKTRCVARDVAHLWKHPRLRGEDKTRSDAWSAISETPPLTRGRLKADEGRAGGHGNTPAYAGKTHFG